ncbi:MAG TPA: hypothetical protein VG711_05670, partial [Phycisphaerales bacterium]|nr:hypothetical protein [Phycisphaerales bacterium]
MRSVAEIVKRTGLQRIQILKAGSALRGIAFDQEKHDGEIYYVKRSGYQRHKTQILKLAGSPKKLAALPTKRNVRVTVQIDGTTSTRQRPRAIALTVDNI